jgi:3-deoxy-7-phosphoheptulonate synthase
MTIVVCFEPGVGEARARAAVQAVVPEATHDAACRWFDPGLLTVRATTGAAADRADDVRGLPGVRRVVTLAPGERLVGRHRAAGEAAVPFGAASIGGGRVALIAGPCSVESAAQLGDLADAVKRVGGDGLRGGAWKPRTSPYSFGGLGERGLDLLATARARTGLPFVTEALEPAHLDPIGATADMVQLGARNMANAPLLFAAGAHPSQRPVLLKRGFGATIHELCDAAEYVLLGRLWAGSTSPGLVLCERGIRTFETSTRFTLDVAAVPVLRELTGLPVVVDPSHPAGAARFVRPLARAAVAAGADGLLVEVHEDPEGAYSDGEQAISIAELGKLAREVRAIEAAALDR